LGGSYPGETLAGVIFLILACIGIYFFKLHGPLRAMLDKSEETTEKKPSEVTVLKYFLKLLLASLYCSFAILVYTIFDGSFYMIVSLFPFTFPNMFFYSFIAMLITSAVAFCHFIV
jgi:hypothetical protein